MNDLSSTNVIHVYVENDFASEMTGCTTNSLDDNLSEAEIQGIIDESIETWNQESTGIIFKFEGVTSAGNPNIACDSSGTYIPLNKRPAILVNLYEGCSNGGNGSCETNVLARARAVTSDCGYVRLYGDQNNTTSCDCSNGGCPEWSIDPSITAGVDIRNVLLHEFGHIAGLARIIHDRAGIRQFGRVQLG